MDFFMLDPYNYYIKQCKCINVPAANHKFK